MLSVGSSVILSAYPGSLRAYADQPGIVVSGSTPRDLVVEVQFEDGTVRAVPSPYLKLKPAEGKKTRRRSVLRLSGPKDERNEAARLADGCAALESLDESNRGYSVMRVGQGRAAAICHQCSRAEGRMVRIQCKRCNSAGYAPSTNSTAGVPDTLIFRRDWPANTLMAVEWKDGPSGKRTPEQVKLEAAGRIIVVWDTPSLFAAVQAFEEADARIIPHPALARYLHIK